MSNFLSGYIIAIVMLNIIGCGLLLYLTRRNPFDGLSEDETTGHSFDGIQELNRPLPRWWMWVFWMAIVFALVYLALYPGLGNHKGLLNWSASSQLAEERQLADQKYGPLFSHFGNLPIKELANNDKALKIGERLFANNCAQCHGSDARGGRGFPNLTDDDWLYGGEPETIEQTILHGRNGNMPALGATIGGAAAVKEVVQHVLTLSGRSANKALAKKGKITFNGVCAACHGLDGKGNQGLGAPNLTDNIWLYGGDVATISETIMEGRHGVMPAQEHILGKDKVHILAAYVYSLSHKP